ncbi:MULTISPECIES: phosphoribosyltransferase family protein [Olivibacter]|jgi:pyrimidine operon attenuation protein/uracil phosphoribosyltransferase|uniref:Phosphoribosyltransferase n=4 Tax=Sphingobacteriaceae TaxID=84566 RepID=F4CDI1_SPHS2|nr:MULTISPECIES: phosphoribosyltransferase family protein [Olivibacter]MCL4641443.1 phosphoribosyltransferase [Olivibacter sp. UJ_SKK_5.1]MDM8177297.1 phosphoribosyltransferase family protein [Olivibacter sp. 47]MDX3912006.1 phosphoribosyltransferase family protein [Pseudosphingobacterium sp.]QEL04269.1 phosphoribosyltransferase [Olivibacter sp. LS-1]
MASEKILILDKDQIQKKITRIAYQILEDNFEEKEIVLAGVAERGYVLARRLKEELAKISLAVDVKLINISLNKVSSTLQAETDISVSEAKDKVVILVDDVLNSGRTLAYGLGVFLNVPLKKLRTAVLIDRSHHKFPVISDFSGHKLSTILNEHVSVTLEGFENEQDAAYLH